VKMTLHGYTIDSFQEAEQLAFRLAVAEHALLELEYVVINDVLPYFEERRATEKGVHVKFHIESHHEDHAEKMANKMHAIKSDSAAFVTTLKSKGLHKVQKLTVHSVEVKKAASPSPPPSSDGFPVGGILGIIGGCLVVMALAGAFVYVRMKQRSELPTVQANPDNELHVDKIMKVHLGPGSVASAATQSVFDLSAPEDASTASWYTADTEGDATDPQSLQTRKELDSLHPIDQPRGPSPGEEEDSGGGVLGMIGLTNVGCGACGGEPVEHTQIDVRTLGEPDAPQASTLGEPEAPQVPHPGVQGEAMLAADPYAPRSTREDLQLQI